MPVCYNTAYFKNIDFNFFFPDFSLSFDISDIYIVVLEKNLDRQKN